MKDLYVLPSGLCCWRCCSKDIVCIPTYRTLFYGSTYFPYTALVPAITCCICGYQVAAGTAREPMMRAKFAVEKYLNIKRTWFLDDEEQQWWEDTKPMFSYLKGG